VNCIAQAGVAPAKSQLIAVRQMPHSGRPDELLDAFGISATSWERAHPGIPPGSGFFQYGFLFGSLIRQNIGIRQDDRIEEALGQVSRHAVLLRRRTAGERGGIVQDTDGDVIA
jgi:hypothetical protein